MSKRFARLLTLSLLLLTSQAYAVEVLVLNSAAVQVDAGASSSRRGFEIQNLGPNAIYCELGNNSPVLTKSHKVGTGETWSAPATRQQQVWCKAATADQVTGAGTIYQEVL